MIYGLIKFTNVTNGVTPRRWLAYSNPALTELLNEHVGYDWVSDMNILLNWKKSNMIQNSIEGLERQNY